MFLNFSCNQERHNSEGNFMKEIPRYSTGELELFYKLAQQKAKQLGLENLENGFDGIQIRIWYDYALVFNRELLVLKNVNSQWSAIHYDFAVDWNYKKLTETIKTVKKRELTPSSGWNNFIKELFDLKIEFLPNMTDVPGLSLGTDGITYNIEFASKNKYRFYGYHLPELHQNKAWQAKNMVDILKLLERELGIKTRFIR
jgi:hypothetical protein